MIHRAIVLLLLAAVPLMGSPEVPSAPRDSNFQRTGAYGETRVHAKFTIQVKEDTKVVHVIRDNSDPRVITRSYLLYHADAYDIRDFLREMVQSKKVGNTALQENFPGNSKNSPGKGYTATTATASPTLPVNAQPTFNPATQLGSNTAVECLKYADGTGLLLISAEEYRFADNDGGMGFDSMVKFLDRPQMGAIIGTQIFFYLPRYVPASNLQPLITNVGMNVSDVTELWQGSDVAACDTELNMLIFDVANYSMTNVEKMLKKYDVPIPQVRLKVTVYEFFTENDDRIGVDFQAWKNNGGMNFFSGGGRFRDNWSALYTGIGPSPTGSERTGFYNFNPKWNTRYLDFLAASGKGSIICSGELLIRNNTPATLKSSSELFYFDTTPPADETQLIKLFSSLVNKVVSGSDIQVWKAPQQQTLKQSSFGFSMDIANASVTEAETNFTVTLKNTSLTGFDSNGVPRFSESTIKDLNISLPHGKNSFVIGGLKKSSVVRSSSGIPILKDIPVLGWLFSTESTSVKRTSLVVTGECISDAPIYNPWGRNMTKPEKN